MKEEENDSWKPFREQFILVENGANIKWRDLCSQFITWHQQYVGGEEPKRKKIKKYFIDKCFNGVKERMLEKYRGWKHFTLKTG